MEVKTNIGEISDDTKAIIEALKETRKEVEGLGDGAKKTKKGFGVMGKAVRGVGNALKTLGIVSIIAAGFTALKEAVMRNQGAMDLMETVMSTISTTFNQIISAISGVVYWVTESTERFDGLSKVLGGVVTIALSGVKATFFGLKLGVQELMLAWEDSFLGGKDQDKIADLNAKILSTKEELENTGTAVVQAGKDIVNNIGDAITEVAAIGEQAVKSLSKISIKSNFEQAEAATAANGAAKFAAATFAKLNAEKLKEAELFRQIRDDETKTFAERIQANKDLKTSLEEQQKLQREQVQIGIRAAELQVAQNGNDENKLALMEAQNAELELEETITGQLSEQKTNAVGLEKELLETQKEIRAEGLSGLERELQDLEDAYKAKVLMAEKAGMKTTAITAKFEKDKTNLVKENLNQQLSAFSGLAGALSSLAGDNKELAVASAIISTFAGANKAFEQGGTIGFVTAAAVIASGLANVQKIMSTDVGAGGGGGGGGGAAVAAPAPQMMSGAFEIQGGVKPEPTRAYVVTDEMTNSQNQLANIRRRATI